LLTISVYIGSSIYTSGLESVMQVFGVSQVAAILGLCLFVAGYGLGPMLWSPMSEIPQIGRNPIYLGTLLVFVALQAPTALASNFGMLLAFRFLTGFFGSPVLATGGASLADIWRPKKRAYAISIWGIAAVSGPTLGPVVGGFAVQYAPTGFGGFTAPWTWPIWMLMWLSAACFVSLFFFCPETSANNVSRSDISGVPRCLS
jgi:DHA1 family multidrug resistance protein-like MFS transporter